jgi:hypothetical protein
MSAIKVSIEDATRFYSDGRVMVFQNLTLPVETPGERSVDSIKTNPLHADLRNHIWQHVCNNIPYLYRPLTADGLKEKLR